MPADIVTQIVDALREDQQKAQNKVDAEHRRRTGRIVQVYNRMDIAYTDRLDGKITEDFGQRKMTD